MAEPYTQEEIDDALTALIAYAGNARAAVRYLQAEGLRAPGPETLHAWARTRHWERYEQLCETVAAGREKALEHRYQDASERSTSVLLKAIDLAEQRIDDGTDVDPGRTAANLAKVAQVAQDKRLASQGRPTQIIENRDTGEIMRSLLAKYPSVFGLADEPALIEAGDDAG